MKGLGELFCRKSLWQGREAYELGNGLVQLVILTGGGHVAEFRFTELSRRPIISPLWIPPWKTIEPHQYRQNTHAARYGPANRAGKLLSGIAGHNICLDYFGTPSQEEYCLGLTDHGEAPNLKWQRTRIHTSARQVALTLSVMLPVAGISLDRQIQLRQGESVVYFKETITNEKRLDHFFHWVQHVTLGPPFLAHRETTVTLPGTRGKTFPHGYDEDKPLLASDREFRWPNAPAVSGGAVDLTRPLWKKGYGFVAGVLLDPRREIGFIAATNERLQLLMGYCFRREDYPWVTVWEENRTIVARPWRGKAETRGLEFGTTPLALPRREAFNLGSLFGTPTLCFVPAKGRKTINYAGFLAPLPADFGKVRDIRLERREILVLGSERKAPLRLRAGGLNETVPLASHTIKTIA